MFINYFCPNSDKSQFIKEEPITSLLTSKILSVCILLIGLAAICRNVALVSMIAAKSHKNGHSEAIREAMSKLSTSAREVIFLRFYDGMSYEQISAVLGISEQAINGRLRRAKKKIANYLRRNGFGKVQL
jgi:predicted DNA-binding protein (UPF0251 family)